jgi:hypothetical protein
MVFEHGSAVLLCYSGGSISAWRTVMLTLQHPVHCMSPEQAADMVAAPQLSTIQTSTDSCAGADLLPPQACKCGLHQAARRSLPPQVLSLQKARRMHAAWCEMPAKC